MMPDPRVNLKNPWIAGVLAYLIPGAGHFYQGRILKGVIYCVCILGTLSWGMALGDWTVVYYAPQKGRISLSYMAQMMTGLPALPAVVQAKRYHSSENKPLHTLTEPLEAPFEGQLRAFGPGSDQASGDVAGTIHLEPVEGPLGPDVRGEFNGTLNGKEIKLPLGGRLFLDRPIAASPGRMLEVEVVPQENQHPQLSQQLQGTVPRTFTNRFEVPPSDDVLQELNGRLGKFYELALVFTWIAGLLNVLAIWDALEGPAYGYGDEPATKPEPEPAKDATVKA